MKVVAWKDAAWVRIAGHGLAVQQAYELADGVWVSPEVPDLDPKGLDACESIKERAAVETMHEIATFSLEIQDVSGGTNLVNKAWNRLWDFHLLSLASKSPCFILYNSSENKNETVYSVANRNLILNSLDNTHKLEIKELNWAKVNENNFRSLISDQQFSSAMRYFGNSHYLFDLEHRIMLLWAGIEGLLQVESEHSRRIALYCAILSKGDESVKAERFEMVKNSYSLRSRVVHGAKPSAEKLKRGYLEATELLADLLARCVELGRVPTRHELDRAAFSSQL